MGCDIHLFIEYKSKNEDCWMSFGRKINPGRNYFLFGILCKGVRRETTLSFDKKGFPEKPGYYSWKKNISYISNSGDKNTIEWGKAKRLVDAGLSKFINNHLGVTTWITHPDWHSHSWLSTSEFEQAMQFFNENRNKETSPEPEYEAILAAMQRFEKLGYDCRIVFWFDN